ncbi:MAG: hypothetical protein ACW99R_15510 [Candidatus Hodarchaeales archaeon]
MENSDPFTQLVDTLAVIENQNRILCLIAVYLGQKADQNTIQGITDILSSLLGKHEQFTTTKTRGLITSLVNGGILEREREKVISSTKVSFHSISSLGYIVLTYVLLTYVVRIDPASIEWDTKRFQDYADSEEKMILFTIDTLIAQEPTLKRVYTSLRTGKDPSKIKLSKSLIIPVTKVFSGNTGYRVFKIFEELIWDYLHYNTGFTKLGLEQSTEIPTALTGSLKKLDGLFLQQENWAKERRYRLSVQGIFILPIFALLIKHFSIDKSLFPTLKLSRLEKDENYWISLTKLGHSFFKTVYRIS